MISSRFRACWASCWMRRSSAPAGSFAASASAGAAAGAFREHEKTQAWLPVAVGGAGSKLGEGGLVAQRLVDLSFGGMKSMFRGGSLGNAERGKQQSANTRELRLGAAKKRRCCFQGSISSWL